MPKRRFARVRLAFERNLRSWPIGLRSLAVAMGAAALAALLLHRVDIVERAELYTFDRLVAATTGGTMDPRLAIVGVTEADIETYGYPLSDATVARLLETLQREGASTIGLDLYHHVEHPPGRSALEAQVSAANVIMVRFVGMDPDRGEVPAPAFAPRERIGFNDLVVDADGIVRRALLFVGSQEFQYYSFALRVAIAHLAPRQGSRGETVFGFDESALTLLGERIPRLQPGSGGYTDADNAGYQTLLRYRAPRRPADMLSVNDVLEGRFDPQQFDGRAVLIGGVAPSLNHLFATPFTARMEVQSRMPGVTVHGQIVSQLLDVAAGRDGLFRSLPPAGEALWVLAWALLAALLVWRARSAVQLVAGGIALPAILVGIAWISVASLFWLPVVLPALAVVVSAMAVAVQRYMQRAKYDVLTALPGRDAFLRTVSRLLQAPRAHPCTVAVMDIDRFDMVNKTLGHAVGDRVLVEIAGRLFRALDGRGTIARTGGDEFAVVFDRRDQDEVERSLDVMHRALGEPLQADRYRLSFTASTGLATSEAGTGNTPGELLRDAHTAMYRAKLMRSNSYELFSDEMREEASVRLALESELAAALEQNEFFLAYQPIVDIDTGTIVGFESLLRWCSATRGEVPPGEFIPVIEETGMINRLGDWILTTAAEQARDWLDRFPDHPLTVNVNLSRRQLERGDITSTLATLLEQLQLPPEALQLEITESMVMLNPEAARELLLDIRRLGLSLAIDDFGTGYSSLSYLHHFPADTLKIDRSFVSRMEDSPEDKIIETILALGRKLEMKLVAEGVETERQLQLLRAAGCDLAQGFLFSRPVPAAQAARLLERRSPLLGAGGGS